MLRSKKIIVSRPKGITQTAVENEIKKKRGGKPQRLEAQKRPWNTSPKAHEGKERKEKNRDLDQKMEEEPA